MANYQISGAVNWTAAAGGDGPAPDGTREPAAGDSLYLQAGAVLTLNKASGATYACDLVRACVSQADATETSGSLVLGSNAAFTLNFNMIGGASSGNELLVIGTGKTVTGVDGRYVRGGLTSGKRGISISGTGTLAGAFEAIAGETSGAHGIVAGNTATATIKTVTGGGKSGAYGLYMTSTSGSVLVTGNVTGGSASGAYGVYADTGSKLTVNGIIKGGSGAQGLYTASTGATIVVGTSLGSDSANIPGSLLNNTGAATFTAATGGDGAGSPGVQMYAGTVTVTVAKGGAATSPGVYAYANSTSVLKVAGVDLTGAGVPVFLAGVQIAAGVQLATVDLAGSTTVPLCQTADVAAAANVRSTIPRWTGATGANVGTLAASPVIGCSFIRGQA